MGSAAPGVMRSAAWARSRRRSPPRRSGSASRSRAMRRRRRFSGGGAVGGGGGEAKCAATAEKSCEGRVVRQGAAEIEARAVVANVNPKLLFLKLVDPAVLERDF